MIYQCFFKDGQQEKLFKQEPYIGFGLEPSVNPNITKNCPELDDPSVRLQLTEYACFLWHWRNPDFDKDSWIGTTSYRQLDKSHFIFSNKKIIEEYTNNNQILGWGFYFLMDMKQHPISIAKQSEVCHPGINEFLELAMKKFGYEMPDKYYSEPIGLFANYWAMNKKMFNQYMEFSWPMVKWALDNRHNYDYFKKEMLGDRVTKDKAVGYFMERLFIVWYLLNNHEVVTVGNLQPLVHRC
jgi:hypothetical protein